VFYVQDPCDGRWSVVLHGKTIGVNLKDDDSTLDTCHTLFSTHMPNINGEEEVDDIHANRNDDNEGELINII